MNFGSKAEAPKLTPEQEQALFLSDARKSVKKNGLLMQRAFDQGSLMDGLKYISGVLNELRTSKLSPNKYYELYMDAVNQLQTFESYLNELITKEGRKVSQLYEVVQYAGNIIPRLYLLVTVGSLYIKSKEESAKKILNDLVEMCRGVQHPLRALFLRNYLSQKVKNCLPDIDDPDDLQAINGTVDDSVSFILTNFGEMNQLWVRLQKRGPSATREKREKERLELRTLVGSNLARLSQLEGVDLPMFQSVVLPKILEKVLECKDQISQQYLMESVIIQVFPDDYLLATLESFLDTCTKLQTGVDLPTVLVSLIQRLGRFSAQSSIPEEINVFDIFTKYLTLMIQDRRDKEAPLSLPATLSMYVSLLSLSLTTYPSKFDYVDTILATCVDIIKESIGQEAHRLDDKEAIKQVVSMLTTPVEQLKDILTVLLQLKNYPRLMAFLPFKVKKQVARKFLTNVIDHVTSIDNTETVTQLLDFIRPIVKPDKHDFAKVSFAEMDAVEVMEFEQEMGLVARALHKFNHADTDIHYELISTAKKYFEGSGDLRIRFTFIPIVFDMFQLALRAAVRERAQKSSEGSGAENDLKDGVEGETNKMEEEQSATAPLKVAPRKMYGFLHEAITKLSDIVPEMSLRLFLTAAKTADQTEHEAIAYEFMTQAFLIYEEKISDSKEQYAAITVVISTLVGLVNFTEDNYDTLTTKTAQYSSKLLKKADQCRAVYLCSHLFWTGEESDPKAVRQDSKCLQCLQKSLKIADACLDPTMHVALFVEILNEYLGYFKRNNSAVTVTYLNTLIFLIHTKIAGMEDSSDALAVKKFFNETISYVESLKTTDERYKEITTEATAPAS